MSIRLPRSSSPVISAERDRQVRQIDQHVHDEKAAHDPLLDVLNIDAALGHVSRKLRDDALLVLSQHADDRQYRLRHEKSPYERA